MLELLLELAEPLALALPFELALPDCAEASDVETSRSDKATATNRIMIDLHRSGMLLLMSVVPAGFQEALREIGSEAQRLAATARAHLWK